MAKGQPTLAGCGALRTMIEMAPLEKPKAKRCSVPVPPFQPDVTWEYPRERLYIRQKLGAGTYSEVWQAKAEGILGRAGQRMVAVKMLRGISCLFQYSYVNYGFNSPVHLCHSILIC